MPHRVFLANALPPPLEPVVHAFSAEQARLGADGIRKVEQVRQIVASPLRTSGWVVANGERRESGVRVPRDSDGGVMADAVHKETGSVLWIETGRSWTNNGFLEHLAEAIPCPSVVHVGLAVRTIYNGQAAFEKIIRFLEPVLTTDRVDFPFRSVVVIGY